MTFPRLRIAVVMVATALALAPLPSETVERWYSSALYPVIQSALTWGSNLVPFALFDILLLVVVGWWVWRFARDISRRQPSVRGWLRVLTGLIARTLTVTAALYVLFLLTWGFNYRRPPITDRLALNPQGVTPEAARQLVLTAIREVNTLYPEAHASVTDEDDTPAVEGSLATAFSRTQAMLAVNAPARPARPKRTLLDPYFTSAGVAGMTDPYFLETLLASDLLPIERPFVVAHEWSHLSGFANEGEANFVGWLTCLRGSALDRYSGWLFLYSEALPGLPRPARTEASALLGAGPRDDLRAIADRLRRHVRPRISNAGWQVYDRYLKANRVEAGGASYREVVRTVLAARFDAAWAPVLK